MNKIEKNVGDNTIKKKRKYSGDSEPENFPIKEVQEDSGESDMKPLFQKCNNKIQKIKKVCAGIKDENAELKKKIHDLNQKSACNKTQVFHSDDTSNPNVVSSDCDKPITNIKEQIRDLKHNIIEMKHNISDLTNKINELTNKINRYIPKIDEIDEIKRRIDEIDKIKGRIDEIDKIKDKIDEIFSVVVCASVSIGVTYVSVLILSSQVVQDFIERSSNIVPSVHSNFISAFGISSSEYVDNIVKTSTSIALTIGEYVGSVISMVEDIICEVCPKELRTFINF